MSDIKKIYSTIKKLKKEYWQGYTMSKEQEELLKNEKIMKIIEKLPQK